MFPGGCVCLLVPTRVSHVFAALCDLPCHVPSRECLPYRGGSTTHPGGSAGQTAAYSHGSVARTSPQPACPPGRSSPSVGQPRPHWTPGGSHPIPWDRRAV